MRRILVLVAACVFAISTLGAPARDSLNTIAEKYAHLVLALGQHDPDYAQSRGSYLNIQHLVLTQR